MAAKSITFELGEFKKDYFIAWTVATQCGKTASITLKAGNAQYFKYDKTVTTHSFMLLGQGSKVYQGEGTLQLTMTVNNARAELQQSITSGAITDKKAKKLGYVYDFCIEDDFDEDFNDIYINIVGWEKMG